MDFKEVKLSEVFRGSARCHGHCIATVNAFYESGFEAAELDWQSVGSCKTAKSKQTVFIAAIRRLGLRDKIGVKVKLKENKLYLYRKDLVAN